MNLLILCPGTDIAGQGYALKQAFDRHSDWETRTVRRSNGRAYDYPSDLVWPLGDRRRADIVADLWRQADVVHIMDNPLIVTEFKGFRDFVHKRIVVEHLGTRYRRNPDAMAKMCQAIGAYEVAASLDLQLRPGVPWLPVTADLERFAAIRTRAYGPSQVVRIAHAPTDRTLKSTDVVLAVIERLRATHDIEFDLIEERPWVECLERKARADILIDELTFGYGLNAIESWAMGIPVVSGIADPIVRRRMVDEFGGLPFYEVTADTLETRLSALILDRGLRAEWGTRGRLHAERFHSERAVIERAIALYQNPAAVAA